jgi:exosortase
MTAPSAVNLARSPSTSPWTPRQLALAGAMVLAAVAALRSSWADWFNISYQIEEHSHVFLAVPFGAAIIYMNRGRLRDVRGGVSWAGPLLVAAGWTMAWYGFTDAHQSMWHMGAVLVALGAAVTILGHDVLIKFWPAFLLLGFMVPVPNGIRMGMATPLQTAMAAIVEKILTTFGEPIGRQGNSITINGQHVLIAEACNGLRMAFPLILVCWLFAFVTPLKNWVRWGIILFSPLVALACNVIRLIPTLLMFGHSTHEAASKFHDYSGWPMIAVAFFLLMFCVKFVEACGFEVRGDDDDDYGGSNATDPKPSGGPAAVPGATATA